MIRFDEIVERFAQAYRPMLHNPENGNTRFFRMNSIQTMDEMLISLGGISSPAVGVEVYLEGSIGAKDIVGEWTVFFFCNGGEATNMSQITDAKAEAFVHMLRFLAVMRRWQKDGLIPSRIDLGTGTSRLRYFTQGPILDNWYAVGTTISCPEAFDPCSGDSFMDNDQLGNIK